jgi:hypothetical protein
MAGLTVLGSLITGLASATHRMRRLSSPHSIIVRSRNPDARISGHLNQEGYVRPGASSCLSCWYAVLGAASASEVLDPNFERGAVYTD